MTNAPARVVKRASIQEIRSAELVDAAKRSIAERGLDKTTVRDVASYAGASPASIAYYFGSKEDLVLKALTEATEIFLEDAKAKVADEDTALAKLDRLAGLLLEPRSVMDVTWRLWLELRAHSVRQTWLRDVFQQGYDNWLAFVEGIIADGVADGEFRTVDTRAAAELFATASDGLSYHLLLARDEDAHALLASFRELFRSFLVAESKSGARKHAKAR
jgi:AcrR family transcriptional regulator